MEKVKEVSKRLIEDKALANILKDKNSTSRQKELAFNKLYANNQRQVMLFFLKKLRDSETAEDLKMITFEKAYDKIASYNDNYAFSTWLYKIAYNTFVDNARSQKQEDISINHLEKRSYDGAVEFQIKSKTLDPSQELERKSRISAVRKAIDMIEDDFIRELIEKRFIEELSFKQIAKEMGIENNSTLRVVVRRGKEILKNELRIANPF